MSGPMECEKYIIEKLISVLKKSLSCRLSSENNNIGNVNENEAFSISDGEASVIEKVLQVLLSSNGTSFSGSESSSGMGSIISDDVSAGNDQNSTTADDVLIFFNDATSPKADSGSVTPSVDDSISSLADDFESTGVSKLHKLEIIKVFVLIFVISIILLTTCRMVFQLFIRFRPEKPPLA